MTSEAPLETKPRAATVHAPEDGPVFSPPSGPQTVKVSRKETQGAFEIIEIDVVPGAGPPLHVHHNFDEAFYVVEGTLKLLLGESFVELGPRGSALVPAGLVHTWTNAGSTVARFLQVTAPGSMEALLEALATHTPTTLEELNRLAEPFGTTALGPPL